MQDKKELRKTLRATRSSLAAEERQQAAVSAAQLLTTHPLFQTSHHIACYIAHRSEIACTPIIEAIWQAKKHCYLPILSQAQDSTLHFARYQKNDALHPNLHHILEPTSTQYFPTEDLDLVLVPLVGFDLQGHRLGTGGGYYDRTFAFLKGSQQIAKKPFLLGLAHSVQQVDSLRLDLWDVGLNGILTQQKLIKF